MSDKELDAMLALGGAMSNKPTQTGLEAASEELAEIATLIYEGKANEALQAARDLNCKLGQGTFVLFATAALFAARIDAIVEKKLGRPTGK
jgi:hypothetical protein